MTIAFEEVSELPVLSGEAVFSDIGFSVFQESGGFLRRYHEHKEGDRPYAVGTMDLERGLGRVRYLPGGRICFSESQNSFSHIAFERWLLRFGRLILHASLVATDFGGLLFSGPSGIGKSTQAELWEALEGGVVINGDKPILYQDGGAWLAAGSPYAGSSRCFLPRSERIAGIFLLRQGPICQLRRLGPAEAFRGLYAGTVLNLWDESYMASACDLLQSLASQVPVYSLTCTPDRRAVEAVKEALAER